MRHGLAALDLVKPLTDPPPKIHPLGNDIQACVCGQTLNRIQGKLLVAHGMNLPEMAGNATALCWKSPDDKREVFGTQKHHVKNCE